MATIDELVEAENAAYIYTKHLASNDVMIALADYIKSPNEGTWIRLDIQYDRLRSANEKFRLAHEARKKGS